MATDHTDSKNDKPHGPPTITVEVFSPREPQPRSFTFAQTLKVGEAAREAAAAFGYPSTSTPSFQTAAGDVLDRDKPLVAAGVRNGDKLEIVDVGGGV